MSGGGAPPEKVWLAVLSLSGREDRLLRLHVQQVHPGSPRLSAGQDREWSHCSSLILGDKAENQAV